MDFDKKELSSYLDGIPFTIGPKFCPPRPVSLPYCIYQLPPSLMSEEYDFSLENRTIALYKTKCEEMEKLKAAEASGCEKTVNPVGQSASLWNTDTVLQPRSQIAGKASDDALLSKPYKKINVSEFENDTTSPFDYMELQTINDLEELNTVFQGLCTSEAVATENSSSGPQEPLSEDVPQQNTVNVSKSISFPLPQSINPIASSSESDSNQKTLEDDLASWTCSVSKSFSKTSDSNLSYSYPSMSSGTESDSSASDKVKRNSLINDRFNIVYQPINDMDCTSSTTGHHSSFHDTGHSFLNSPLRSSKSIPDLSTLDPNKMDRHCTSRSHTPPASIIGAAGTTYSSSEKAAILRKLNEPNVQMDHYLSNNGYMGMDSQPLLQNSHSPTDPYDELSDLAKRIIDTITEMGFQRGQVSRTVQHLGMDEKKVVEHLCQIQALEESGYDILEAEAALHLHDYNKKEAIRYLDLLNQFQDFGFERDVIKKALVQNKNDRDKAIEALLS